MNELEIGRYVYAIAGHDAGKIYVIFQMDKEYVYLVDGRIRKLDHPKKKKKIHIRMLSVCDSSLIQKVNSQSVRNEEIKRAIKLLQQGNSSKEVE